MLIPATEQVLAVLSKKGYVFYTSGSYHLNLIGVRSSESQSDKFDDQFHVIYREPHKTDFEHKVFDCTTDPGKSWLQVPMNSNGCAIMCPGQYKDAYVVGMHQGKYPALTQKAPIWFVRDNNRDTKLDFSLYATPEERRANAFIDVIGANIHRASALKKVFNVANYSAACIVIDDPKEFDVLMDLAKKQGQFGSGLRFTWTLLEEKDFCA